MMAADSPGAAAELRLQRWAGISGIVFVLLLAAFAALLSGVGLDWSSATAQDIARVYDDPAIQFRESTTIEVFSLGIFFFLWFLGGLRSRLRSAEGAEGTASSVAFAGGLAAAAFFWSSNAASGAFTASLSFYQAFENDPQLAILLSSLSFQLLVVASVSAGTLIAAASVVALRSGVFPRWVAWAGFVAAAFALLGGIVGFGFIALPIWVLLVSIFLLRPVARVTSSSPVSQLPHRSYERANPDAEAQR